MKHAGLHAGVDHLADTPIEEEGGKAATEKELLEDDEEDSEDVEEVGGVVVLLEGAVESKANDGGEEVDYANDEEDEGGVEISHNGEVKVVEIETQDGCTDQDKDETNACEHDSVF